MINSHHAHVVFFVPHPGSVAIRRLGTKGRDHQQPFAWLQTCLAAACLPPITNADVSSYRDLRGTRPCPGDASQAHVQIEWCQVFCPRHRMAGTVWRSCGHPKLSRIRTPRYGVPLRREATAVPVIIQDLLNSLAAASYKKRRELGLVR